jgi:hypothetical protein
MGDRAENRVVENELPFSQRCENAQTTTQREPMPTLPNNKPPIDESLREQLERLRTWPTLSSNPIKTNFDRSMHVEFCRLIEALLGDEPSTPLPQRHHP